LTTFTFADLKLSQESLHALERAGFVHPTPIQARAIPPALEGKDVIGTAATGTGKTAAFLLPIIERLAGRGRGGPRALVLAPTRELAIQISEQLNRFGKARHVRAAVVIGGVGLGRQAAALRDHEVIVATPGRLIDHLQQGNARLGQLEILVLDEADRMLDVMGFRPQLDRILARVPKERQTLLFSATMAGEVADFARTHLVNPVRVEVSRSATTPERAEQRVFLAGQREKLPLLLALLGDDEQSTLVFTRTKRRADKVAKVLERAGHKATRIHADRSQGQRRSALNGFREGTYRVLVATDIAARGIDIAEIGHVVNFDLPHVPEDYVHRVGRTARMAASGRASSFASPEEADLLHGIERLTCKLLPRSKVPRESEVFRNELARAEMASANAGPPGRRSGTPRGGAGHVGARPPRARPAAPADAGGPPSGAPPRRPKLLGSWGTNRRRGRR